MDETEKPTAETYIGDKYGKVAQWHDGKGIYAQLYAALEKCERPAHFFQLVHERHGCEIAQYVRIQAYDEQREKQ